MHAANYTVSASGRMHVPYTGANRAAIRIRLRLRLDLAPVAINNYAVLTGHGVVDASLPYVKFGELRVGATSAPFV